jgi:hypothetical protein
LFPILSVALFDSASGLISRELFTPRQQRVSFQTHLWRKHNEMDCPGFRGGGFGCSQFVDSGTNFHDRIVRE